MIAKNIPYYKQLGYSSSIKGIRKILENRIGLYGNAIRIELVIYMDKEGKSKEGCPIAKSIIRRSSSQEIVLALVRRRKGHKCQSSYIIVSIVVWDAIDLQFADNLFDMIVNKVNDYGIPTKRRCAQNESKTCGCQGTDISTNGACYSYGCGWSMFTNGCKFRNSQHKNIRKFRLKKRNHEYELEYHLNKLATGLATLYEAIAPDAYHNQIFFEKQGSDCRVGNGNGRPFSGVTVCLDFCAHTHKDQHNMNNGSTLVVTLTNRSHLKTDCIDEQFHVLPMYSIARYDELGSVDKQLSKLNTDSINILNKYPQIKRILSTSRQLKSKKNKNDKTLLDTNECQQTKKIDLNNDNITEYYSDNELCFEDKSMGGLGLALTHRSVLFECAKHELHSTTSLKQPNRRNPSRISLVLYQHRALNHPKHGFNKK
ncbi:methylcytosine dioxygenase TET2-like [Oppia nitens]|uniref:methylcytosine dioxygenase TET2-like n=1 Tax=Oppia nitens TaxID=1686743 RepID=UPI0023DC6BEF|nr:methylcytosine dioxygenase TET2-like [Oppia nitens]